MKAKILQRIFNKKISTLSNFAKFDSKAKTFKLSNFIGEWRSTQKYEEYLDPLHGHKYLEAPLTERHEMDDIIKAMKSTPVHGLHNPFKNVNRYLLYGDICRKATEGLNNKEIFDHFVKLIQRVFPKSDFQAVKEMEVTRDFFANFCGDNVCYFELF